MPNTIKECSLYTFTVNGTRTKTTPKDITARAAAEAAQTTANGKQDALTTAQLAAVNSGVTAAKVAAWDAIEVPTKTSDLTNDSGFITAAAIPTETSDLVNDSGFITAVDIPAIPTKTSDLTNDSGFITSAPVASVNGKTGAVSLGATDVGALPDSTVIPSKTSQLTNDSGFLTAAPVTSVNGKTGAVSLDASDVGALPSSTAIPSKTSDLTNDSGFITASALPSVPSASTTNPAMDGTASAGSSGTWSRGDHVHPHDSTKQDALTAAQLAAVNSGITAEKVAGYDELKKYTLTYTSNSYVTNYAFNRFTVHKVGPHLAILNFQLSLSAAMNVSDFVTIGQTSGLSLAVGSLHIVSGQHGTGTTVTVYVTTSGAIRLYSESGVAGEWYRAMIPLIIN